jgi:predicted nucleic acid-binding protein
LKVPALDCGASQPRTRLSLTSFSHVIDSYPWIEYFRASPAGERAKKLIEGEGSATPSIVGAEVSRKLLREVEAGKETREERGRHLEFIRASSQILHLTFDMAASAGEIDVEMKKKVRGWGLVDSIILTFARSAGARVVTGDEHFREIKEAIML